MSTRTALYQTMRRDLNSLASIVGVRERELQKYLSPNTSQSFLYHLCSSLQNSGMMTNTILFRGINNLIIKEVMCDYDSTLAFKKYKSWQDIYNTFLSKGILDKGSRKNKETNWEKYCKGLYEGLQFLDGGGDSLIRELSSSKELNRNNLKKVKDISKRIHGLGFALTCDWLKECGCTWLAKPDTHLNDVIKAFKNTRTITDEEVLEEVYFWANEIELRGIDLDITAYKLDRIIWLLCTENFFLDKKSSGKDALIRKIKEE